MTTPKDPTTGKFFRASTVKTAQLKKMVLERYAQFGTQTAACKGICPRQNPYEWCKKDPEFAVAWEEAAQIYIDKLALEADRRAYEGVSNPVYQGGELVGHKQEYSDTLLMFRLKRLDPQYRDRTEITGKNGGPVTIRIVEDSVASSSTS